MSIFHRAHDGWSVFKESAFFIFKKPIFLVPILFSWMVVASVILYTKSN